MQDELKPCPWMPIASAPMDEEILAAIQVCHKDGRRWWERHVIVIDSETSAISDMDFHHGWEASDYEAWQPLPPAPDAHPPTTNPVDDRETPVGDHQMVEAVAKALCEACGDRWSAKDFTETLSGNDPDDVRAHYFDLAQAAISAMPSLAAKDAEIARLREAVRRGHELVASVAKELP